MQYFLDLVVIGLTIGILYGLIALGISFIYSGLDMIHFAHGEIYMFGAFLGSTGMLTGLPYPAAFFGATIGAGLLGILVERFIYRRLTQGGGGLTVEGMGLIICGFGVSIGLVNLAYLIWGPGPRALHVDFGSPLHLGSVLLPRTYLLIFIVAIVLMALLHYFLKHMRLGLSVRAMAYSRNSAYLMGVNVPLTMTVIFGIACVLAGAAGVLAAPVTYMGVEMGGFVLIKAFSAAVVGGLGSLPGAIIGGLVVGIVESFGSGYLSPDYKDIYPFLVLMLVLLIRPTGFLGKSDRERA